MGPRAWLPGGVTLTHTEVGLSPASSPLRRHKTGPDAGIPGSASSRGGRQGRARTAVSVFRKAAAPSDLVGNGGPGLCPPRRGLANSRPTSNTHKNKVTSSKAGGGWSEERGGTRLRTPGWGQTGRVGLEGRGGGGLQTWRGECVFAPSVSSGYGYSSGQAGTGIQRVKSIGAERGLLPLIIFTHERLSNNGLQPHVGAGMLLHRLASAGHEAWERDTHTGARGAGGTTERGRE